MSIFSSLCTLFLCIHVHVHTYELCVSLPRIIFIIFTPFIHPYTFSSISPYHKFPLVRNVETYLLSSYSEIISSVVIFDYTIIRRKSSQALGTLNFASAFIAHWLTLSFLTVRFPDRLHSLVARSNSAFWMLAVSTYVIELFIYPSVKVFLIEFLFASSTVPCIRYSTLLFAGFADPMSPRLLPYVFREQFSCL